MRNVRTWASNLLLATLILLAPIIGLSAVVAMEMLIDVMARLGAPVVLPAAAAVVGWVLLRKYGWHPSPSRLGPEGA